MTENWLEKYDIINIGSMVKRRCLYWPTSVNFESVNRSSQRQFLRRLCYFPFQYVYLTTSKIKEDN